MKNKALIIALAALVVLVGIYAALVMSGGGEEETHDHEAELKAEAAGDAIVLTDHELNSFSYLSYSFAGGETLSFNYSAKGWLVDGQEDYPIDYFLVEDIVKPLCNITASRLLTDDPSFKAEYGLEPAKIKVILRDFDGNEYIYNIGDKHPTTHQYYFNIEGQNEIYTVPTGVAMNMAKYDTYGSLIIMPDYPVASMSATESITVAKGGETDVIVRLPEGSDESYTSDYVWFYEGAEGKTALDEASFTNYFNAAAMPTVQFAVDYSKDPEKLAFYGLAEGQDYYTISIKHEDASEGIVTETYYVGLGEDGKAYSRIEGSYVIGSIITKFGFFDFEPETYRARDFFRMKADTVDKMVIVLEGQRHVINIDRSGEKDICTVNGLEQDMDNTLAFINTLRGIAAEGTAEGVPAGEPYIEVSFTRNTETFGEMSLRLWEYDGNFYISEFAGNTLLINKRDVESIMASISELAAR